MMDSSPGTKKTKTTMDHQQQQQQPPQRKRPASSQQLLPAFEPLSSSPGLPNTSKRHSVAGTNNAYLKYPTPVPTSSTGILSSSPPPPRVQARSGLQRTQSVVSERAPLSAVPSIELNENGDMLLMGRSSNSSQYQLSANRLISRVHIKARYIPASVPLEPNKIEIVCNGWNGLKLHCQGRNWTLSKGDTFTSETEGAEIMLDVQDARVLVNWPKRDAVDVLGNLSDSNWDDSPRSVKNARSSSVGAAGLLQSSPLRRTTRIASPESPTPAHPSVPRTNLQDLFADEDREREASVQIYEDADADELPKLPEEHADQSFATDITNSFSSDLSDPLSDDDQDPNEENDPVVHSFGPFGANLNSRMASFHTSTPKRRRLDSGAYADESATLNSASRALSAAASSSSSTKATTPLESTSRKATPTPTTEARFEPENAQEAKSGPDLSKVDVPTILNHVVNQLAFSRLSSTPLSTIMTNLPGEEKKDLTKDMLKHIIEASNCIGIIRRQGKDAAGKQLESEYYYVPEQDTDTQRRAAVVDGLRKPSLRNCRKQHVVCSLCHHLS